MYVLYVYLAKLITSLKKKKKKLIENVLVIQVAP